MKCYNKYIKKLEQKERFFGKKKEFENMKLKKTLALLCALSMMAMAATACGSDDKDSSKESSTSSSESSKESSKEESSEEESEEEDSDEAESEDESELAMF